MDGHSDPTEFNPTHINVTEQESKSAEMELGGVIFSCMLVAEACIFSIFWYYDVMYNIPLYFIGVMLIGLVMSIPIACNIIHFPRTVNVGSLMIVGFMLYLIWVSLRCIKRYVAHVITSVPSCRVFTPWRSRPILTLLCMIITHDMSDTNQLQDEQIDT